MCIRDRADKLQGDVLPVDAGFLNYVKREPIGVVGQIVPWNFPLMFTSWKLGPALAAGNTVVMKPSELTPLSTLRIAELALEVGFPPGVLNVVPGYGHTAGARIADHPDIGKISFTGSTATGRSIVKASAGSLKKLQLITIACARDNTAESCAKSRELADPLMDHPRLPASCKDLIWSIVQDAKPASSNSYQRREALSDPAQRLLLVCRSMERAKPETQQPQAPNNPKKGGFGFGGS